MRIASRVIGVVLALVGIAFFILACVMASGSLDDPKSVLQPSSPNPTKWVATGVCATFGVGLFLVGWRYLKTDPEPIEESSPQSPSRLGAFILCHRRELKLIAQAGLLISLIRLGVACFGRDWPGKWKSWLLSLLAAGLLFLTMVSGETDSWESVPSPMRPLLIPLLRIGQVAFVVLALMFVWNQWHRQFSPRFIEAGFSVLLFAWEALDFAYGEMGAAKAVRGLGKPGVL